MIIVTVPFLATRSYGGRGSCKKEHDVWVKSRNEEIRYQKKVMRITWIVTLSVFVFTGCTALLWHLGIHTPLLHGIMTGSMLATFLSLLAILAVKASTPLTDFQEIPEETE